MAHFMSTFGFGLLGVSNNFKNGPGLFPIPTNYNKFLIWSSATGPYRLCRPAIIWAAAAQFGPTTTAFLGQ